MSINHNNKYIYFAQIFLVFFVFCFCFFVFYILSNSVESLFEKKKNFRSVKTISSKYWYDLKLKAIASVLSFTKIEYLHVIYRWSGKTTSFLDEWGEKKNTCRIL